jgi:hypothetical protein
MAICFQSAPNRGFCGASPEPRQLSSVILLVFDRAGKMPALRSNEQERACGRINFLQ